MKYKVLVMEDIGKLNIRELDVPEPGKGEVLVKVKNCNICTTDWQNWNGMRGHSNKKFPYAPGHESCGIIEKVGPGVEIYKPGDYVAVGYSGCGYCRDCRLGNTVECKITSNTTIGDVSGGFGMSQYQLVRAADLFIMNPDLPYEQACYLEPTATSVHGMRKLNVKEGDTLLVIGAGNLGLVNAQVARGFGCKTFVSEINPERIQIAKDLGFEVVNPAEDRPLYQWVWRGQRDRCSGQYPCNRSGLQGCQVRREGPSVRCGVSVSRAEPERKPNPLRQLAHHRHRRFRHP